MKYIIVVILLISQFAKAQDCKLNKETDPYTKETKLSTGFIFLEGASVTIDADSKEIDMLFSIEGKDKCFDNDATAVIIFEGVKQKTTLRNNGTMNCEGLFHFIFKNSATTTSVLKRLSTQKITQITFTGNNKKQTIINIPLQEQQSLVTLATCLVNDAKALIK
jgi:hypothetical protein